MGFYQTLMAVSVDHQYFSNGMWQGLKFVPNAGTVKLMECAIVLVRPALNGIVVYYDEDKSKTLGLYADDEGTLRFGFKVFIKDREFANYTELALRKENSVLLFENSTETSESGAIRLSKEEFASEQDFVGISDLIAQNVLGENDSKVPPDFVVNISIQPNAKGGMDAKGYNVKFNARQTYWQYYLLGNMNRSNLSIIDMDSKVTFEYLDDILLDSRAAKVFRSQQLIPVLEASNYRFQLREQNSGAEKVLIKRLPLASKDRLGIEVIDSKSLIVSESYVNF